MVSPKFSVLLSLFLFHSSPKARAIALRNQGKPLQWFGTGLGPYSEKYILKYLNNCVCLSGSRQRLNVMYLLSVCCRKQMLSLLLTKAALLLDLVKEELGSFLPFLYFSSRCLFSDLFFKSQSLPLCFFPSPAPPAFAGLTNTFISSHKNCTNIELTTMMLDQRKGLMLQAGIRIYRHVLLVSLWYPMGPGVCFGHS